MFPITVPNLVLTQVGNATAANGFAVYTGTITGGGSNAFVGYTFQITGFALNNGVNNGTYSCVASGTTTITLYNPVAVAETHSGTANGWLVNAPHTGTYPNYPAILGTAVPDATATIFVANAPSGASLVAVNYINGWNYVNSKMSVQVDLDTIEGPQQGTPAISNAASVLLNGFLANQLQFFKYQ